MKRAPIMLDVHFDPEIAPLLRKLGFDVVQVGRGPWSPTDCERVLLTIDGMAQDWNTAATHEGPTMQVTGPLDSDAQMFVARRFARLVRIDDDGQLYLLDSGDDDGEA